ncbi:hypothetical protein [Nocardia thailandica]|uniref:hypothetical protein n=1 Tax=Nocardia thailandica TaxID=257275 RepID=UPI0002D48971|nr:hypothetical protein [Nocardia thailandica]
MSTDSSDTFVFDSSMTSDLQLALSNGFSALRSVITDSANSDDLLTGIQGSSIAQACSAAGSIVRSTTLDLGLNVHTLSTKVGQVIDTISALEQSRTQQITDITGDLA